MYIQATFIYFSNHTIAVRAAYWKVINLADMVPVTSVCCFYYSRIKNSRFAIRAILWNEPPLTDKNE